MAEYAAGDPRWEWVEVSTVGGDSYWIKGRCRHTDVVPVESAGEIVAHLCKTCDQQLPEEWSR